MHKTLFTSVSNGKVGQMINLTKIRETELKTYLFSKSSHLLPVCTTESRGLMLIFCDAFSNNPWLRTWVLSEINVVFHSPTEKDHLFNYANAALVTTRNRLKSENLTLNNAIPN